MVDSNQQRENLLPSEKAFSYKMKLEAMKHQETLLDLCRIQQCSPSLSQAVRLKALHQKGKLTEPELIKIMAEQKANQKDKLTFRADNFTSYFPKGYTADQMEKSIINMLEERKRLLLKSRNDVR